MALDATSISTAYQQAIGRQPTEGDIQYWQNYESQGSGLDVNTLVHYLLNGVRDDPQKLAALVSTPYQEKLQKAPTQQEIDWWSEQIHQHMPSGGDDAALGSDEPFTYEKLVTYVTNPVVQQTTQAVAQGQPVPAASGGQPQQQHQGGGGLFGTGIKLPWQK
jgi:hypothetical protein